MLTTFKCYFTGDNKSCVNCTTTIETATKILIFGMYLMAKTSINFHWRPTTDGKSWRRNAKRCPHISF
ncbi:unnamed protein product [Meloidogyne enterolobii]|uniref:Uncharacterized protein n=1 Tax=Meloidogyne enterolobii TaxID=390850 RepID=A0ACB1ACK8_MELEN